MESTKVAGLIKAFHPPRFLALFFAWTLIGVLSFTRYCFQAKTNGLHPGIWPDALLWLACFYPWVLLSPVVFYLENRFRLGEDGHSLRNSFALAAFGVPLSLLAIELRLVLTLVFEWVLRLKFEPLSQVWSIELLEFFYHLIPYAATVGASYVLRHFSQLREREREAARFALEKSRLESGLRLAELEALRMKLNPHFLFNTLQNISVLAQQDPPTAGRMLSRLGDLLRASLRKTSQQEIPLGSEIELTKAYLEMERMRFPDRLSVTIDIDSRTETALVPTFLLQPIVENAIKHGLGGPNPSGRIHIRSEQQLERLVLTVVDNGRGIPGEALERLPLGIGLGSILERLQRLYSDQHEFNFRNVPEGGTEVRISVPLRFGDGKVEAKNEHAAHFHC